MLSLQSLPKQENVIGSQRKGEFAIFEMRTCYENVLTTVTPMLNRVDFRCLKFIFFRTRLCNQRNVCADNLLFPSSKSKSTERYLQQLQMQNVNVYSGIRQYPTAFGGST